MQILDAHVHFWQPDQLRYPWLDDLPTLNQPFLPEYLPTGGANWSLDGLVFVQADCLPEQGLKEAQWVAQLAMADPRIMGIVAFAPLEQGEGVRPLLEQLRIMPLVKGIRRLIQSEGAGFAMQPGFVSGVGVLAQYGFSFDLCVKHHQLPDIIALVRECPDIRFVLDHAGKPDIANGEIDRWRANIQELAAYPNVWCKLSGMITEADHQRWQPSDLKPYIDHVLTTFGVERLMFGSDAPVLHLAATYKQWVETTLNSLRALSPDEQRQVFTENAKIFYRIGQ